MVKKHEELPKAHAGKWPICRETLEGARFPGGGAHLGRGAAPRLKIHRRHAVWGPFGRAGRPASLGTVRCRPMGRPTFISFLPSRRTNWDPGRAAGRRGIDAPLHHPRRVRSDLYEAVVEEDGCLSSLRVDGVEFLHPGLDVSRGSYFLQKGPQRLTDLRQPEANVLTADGANASIRYEFGPDKMTWALENKSKGGDAVFHRV